MSNAPRHVDPTRKLGADPQEMVLRYRAFFEQGPDGVVVLDPDDASILEFNDQACRQLGYSREEFAGLKVTDVDALQSEEKVRDVIAGVVRDGRHDFETVQRTKQGELRYVHVTAQLLDLGGRRIYHCIWRDITDRKRVEQFLEHRLVALTQPAADDTPIAFEDLFNLEDIQRLQEEFALATGVASVITHPDGTPITVPSRFCRLCKDIIRQTEKGRANCYRSDAELGRMRAGGPVVRPCMSGGLWDAGAGISVGGRPVANWLIGQVRDGTQSEETMRAYAREIGIDEEEAVAAFREVPSMSREQFGHVAQVLYTLANQLSSMAYHNVQQARLISELRRAQQEQRDLQEQLSQAQKMESIGRLAGGVAHDFNNMLSVIIGHAELALESTPPAEPICADLVEISKAAERSASLVRQLLAFARKQPVSPRIIDLNATVEAMLDMLRRLIGESVDLSWSPDRDLHKVRLDPSQVNQILTNLCVNARDAIGGVGRISIRTRNADVEVADAAAGDGAAAPGRYVELEVADTGCGMTEDVQRHLFEPFYTTKGLGRGTGLGLATVYGIVKQNGGFVSVESRPGQGTLFRLQLPASIQPSRPDARSSGGTAAAGHGTVLLVEDEAAILRLQRVVLERLGYEVMAAGTAAEAIRMAEQHHGRIDLLLTDVVMPEMNGRDLATRLRSIHPELRPLFMSGYTADVIAPSGVLEEGVAFIEKPFTAIQLAEKVREALDRP